MQDTDGHAKSPLPLAGEVGRGTAAGQPGRILPGQERASRRGPRIAVRGRPSLASRGGGKSGRNMTFPAGFMTKHDVS